MKFKIGDRVTIHEYMLDPWVMTEHRLSNYGIITSYNDLYDVCWVELSSIHHKGTMRLCIEGRYLQLVEDQGVV